jgi:hypothetical protein
VAEYGRWAELCNDTPAVPRLLYVVSAEQGTNNPCPFAVSESSLSARYCIALRLFSALTLFLLISSSSLNLHEQYHDL